MFTARQQGLKVYRGERFSGISHVVGAALALDEKLRHAHGVWHLFVLAGSASHYFAILFYVA